MVISGTLHLPVTQENVKADDVRRIDHLLRELEFHPERWLEPGSPSEAKSIDNWGAQKRRWIDTPASPSNARARTRAIRQANDELQPYLAERRQQLLVERSTIVEHLRARSVWSSRDYAFCLYPEQALRNFLLDFPTAKP
jgi:hypothetical protein